MTSPVPVALDVGERRGRSPASVLSAIAGRSGLARVRRIGTVLLAAQLAALVVWSFVRAGRFALTFDFSIYYQAWWLIAHGHLIPFDSVFGRPFWQNHGEFLMWPFGLFGLISTSPVVLLVIQAVALVGAEWVSFRWVCDVVEEHSGQGPAAKQARLKILIASVGLMLLVANPWVYWSDSFDFHFEVVGIFFVVLAGRDLFRAPQRHRVWVWVALALLSGDVVTTYAVALGLSAVLAGQQWRRQGAIILVAGIAWAILLTVFGANRGSDLVSGYGYLALAAGVAAPAQLGLTEILKGILLHPGRVLQVLWSRRLDVYAITLPSGLIGIFSRWAAVVAALVIVESGLNHLSGFIAPSSQDLLLFVLLPVGTVHVLVRVCRRHRRWAAGLAVALALNTVGWSIVWMPQLVPQWIRVSSPAASALASVREKVPGADEVVASQGIAGNFAGRRWIYDYSGAARFPLHTKTVWIVVAPSQGIELASTSEADALIEELAGPLHAELVVHRAGIWAFRWSPPPHMRHLTVPASYPTIASWTTVGAAGAMLRAGPEADWRAVATGRKGYVVSGDYWAVPGGVYEATAVLSSTVPVNVEVWNETGDVMLFRRSVPPTNGQEAIGGLVNDTRVYPPRPVYSGVGPFRILPTSPTRNNRLEIRVWSPGGGAVSVASLELQRAGNNPPG